MMTRSYIRVNELLTIQRWPDQDSPGEIFWIAASREVLIVDVGLVSDPLYYDRTLVDRRTPDWLQIGFFYEILYIFALSLFLTTSNQFSGP